MRCENGVTAVASSRLTHRNLSSIMACVRDEISWANGTSGETYFSTLHSAPSASARGWCVAPAAPCSVSVRRECCGRSPSALATSRRHPATRCAVSRRAWTLGRPPCTVCTGRRPGCSRSGPGRELCSPAGRLCPPTAPVWMWSSPPSFAATEVISFPSPSTATIVFPTHQNRKNIVWRFSLNIDSVHFNDFVADVDEARPVSGPAVHDTRDYYLSCFLVGFNGCALKVTIQTLAQFHSRLGQSTNTHTSISFIFFSANNSRSLQQTIHIYTQQLATYYNRLRTLCSILFIFQ